MAPKDNRKLIASLEAEGWRVKPTKGGHYQALAPDGKGIVHIPGTPSDHRSMRNTIAKLRQHGYKGKG